MNLWTIEEVDPGILGDIVNTQPMVNVIISPEERITMPVDKGMLIKNAVNEYLVMNRRNCRIFDNEIQLSLFTLDSDLQSLSEEQLSFWSLEPKDGSRRNEKGI